MSIITEEIVDQAIAAAKEGHVNGLTYSQSSWCGTACCVLGFARHIAGLPEQNLGPQDEEFEDSPRIRAIRQLMTSPTPAILSIMERVTPKGKILLAGAVLTGADLTRAVLTAAVLTGADLTGAVLAGADLTRAVLTGADLTGAVLAGAVLTGAVLTGAVLAGADLTGAVLAGADLRGADLRGADLTRADLRGAVLAGADLRRAVLTGIRYWDGDKYVAATSEWLREKGAIL